MKESTVREQLLQLLSGGNAHMSFDQAVKDFPPEAINDKPTNVSYTPWHLLEHVRIAQWDILEFIRDPDHVSPDWPSGYWPRNEEEATEESWQQTVGHFHSDLNSLREIVRDPDTNLTARLPHAPGYTILREILVVSDHNAYHIGELGILRQVMGWW